MPKKRKVSKKQVKKICVDPVPLTPPVPEIPKVPQHKFEFLSEETIGDITETFYVHDIAAVGCVVRYVHRHAFPLKDKLTDSGAGAVISSGVFFVPDVTPLNGELRRSLR